MINQSPSGGQWSRSPQTLEEGEGRDPKIPKIEIVMPAHNEEKKIGKVLENIPWDIVHKVIVVDDCSEDNTSEIARQHGAHVVRHEKNRGVGAAYKTGYEIALADGADIIVSLHSDGQHDPLEIQKLVDPLVNDGADYVLGSRLKANEIHMSNTRLLGNRLLTWFIKLMTGYDLTDSQTGYHAISRRALEGLSYSDWSDGFAVETDTLAQASAKRLRVKEVPVKCIYSERSHVRAGRDGPKIAWAALKGRIKRLL